eukprot:gene6623-13418_t
MQIKSIGSLSINFLILLLVMLFEANFFKYDLNNFNLRRLSTSEVMESSTYKLPLGLAHQTKEEAKFLQFHKCKDSGEVYGAAYLITKELLINQFTDYNLKNVNCEMGSFIMYSKNILIQSLDVLDFSTIHLSAYERLQRRYSAKFKNKAFLTGKIDLIHTSVKILQQKALESEKRRQESHILHKSNYPNLDKNITNPSLRTVVIMPFLGSDMGAGHSNLDNRLVYLKACFWSIYVDFPNIVAVVKTPGDRDFALNTSGLPFYDVILVDNLPKSASLPVATVQQTKLRLQNGTYDFDYVYFTESDQILMMRIESDLFAYLKAYPMRLIVPHRLMPYPKLISSFLNKTAIIISDSHPHHPSHPIPTTPTSTSTTKNTNINTNMNTNTNESITGWLNMSCCMPRQNCANRKTWVSVRHPSVSIVPVFELDVALGNTNFREETYRACELSIRKEHGICP